MKGLPSFDFDVRQEWIDLSVADEIVDEEEEKRNWEWFQVPHVGHASPRKAPQKTHSTLSKTKPAKGSEEDFIRQMLKEHNAKVKQSRNSSLDQRGNGSKTSAKRSIEERPRKTPSEERLVRKVLLEDKKSSLDCNWYSVPQESISCKKPKEVDDISPENDPSKPANDANAPNRRLTFVSPGSALSKTPSSSESSDSAQSIRKAKSHHEDLQEMLVELKAKQSSHAALRVAQSETKATIAATKRKLPKEQVELQLLVQQHNDKHKRRLSSH